MIINPQTLRGIYMGFNTLFNKAFEGVTPMYTEVATAPAEDLFLATDKVILPGTITVSVEGV